MKLFNSIEKMFLSVTYAEERIFRFDKAESMLDKWNQLWMSVAFAEEGILYPKDTIIHEKAGNRNVVCELGDISCFLLRNA